MSWFKSLNRTVNAPARAIRNFAASKKEQWSPRKSYPTAKAPDTITAPVVMPTGGSSRGGNSSPAAPSGGGGGGRRASAPRAQAPAPVPASSGVPQIQGFDAGFYAQQYPEVAQAYGNDPERLRSHFIQFGMKEGRAKNLGEAARRGQTPSTRTDNTLDVNSPNNKPFFDSIEAQKQEAERRRQQQLKLSKQEFDLQNKRFNNSVGDYKDAFDYSNQKLVNARDQNLRGLTDQKNRQFTSLDNQREDLTSQFERQGRNMDQVDEQKKLEIMNIFAARGTSSSSEFNKVISDYQGNTVQARQDFNTEFTRMLGRIDQEKQLLDNEYSTRIGGLNQQIQNDTQRIGSEYQRAIRDLNLDRKGLTIEQMKNKEEIQSRFQSIFNQLDERKSSTMLELGQKYEDANRKADAIKIELGQRKTEFDEQVRQYENDFSFQKQQASQSASRGGRGGSGGGGGGGGRGRASGDDEFSASEMNKGAYNAMYRDVEERVNAIQNSSASYADKQRYKSALRNEMVGMHNLTLGHNGIDNVNNAIDHIWANNGFST